MSTQSSLIQAALLACAFALAGVVLGCADEEAAGDLLGPVATLTPISPADLHADSSTTVDTANVAPSYADELMGAVVNEDGSITKGGIDIGEIAAPGPIGPTGTTGVPGSGGGTGGSGSGSGGGAVPDKGAPIFNPAGPALEVWCMVRITYVVQTGEILDAEILYCWDDGGGGGSGGGGNNNNNNQQQVTFSLSCDPSVTRGRHAGCRVDASTEDGEIDTDQFSFSWSSSLGASASGIGKDEWGGSSVEDVTVTVSVGGYSASKDINVRPRSNWGTNTLNERPRYRTRSFFRSGVLGNYVLHAGVPRVPSPVEGSGPWDDVYRMPDNAPQVSAEMNVSSDYSAAGGMYGGARATCPPDSNNLQASASYWTVNGKCGTLNVLTAFRNSIIRHEEEHEDGYNRCIRSARARRVMAQMEAETGTRGAVASATSNAWNDLYRNHIHGAVGTGSAFSSTGRYHWYDTRWYDATDAVRQDGGPGGC